MTGLLQGKRGLVLGVANHHSIAWGITAAAAAQGARVALTYQNDVLKPRVEKLASTLTDTPLYECDVQNPAHIDSLAKNLKGDGLDFIVHSLAFASRQSLESPFIETSEEDFVQAMTISCYSLIALTRALAPIMNDGGSILTLTYIGSRRVIPSYNLMGVAKAALEASVRYLAHDLGPRGIRVNAISAGTMRTLAASAIGGARTTHKISNDATPLSRELTLDELGGAGVYLLSDLSTAVTGEVHSVDCGFHTVGLAHPG
ncbi:MAG: enoyl-ACP reductase [Pseudomonadota bacterium]